MTKAEVEYNEDSILVLFDRTIENMRGNELHGELLSPVKIARLLFTEINKHIPKRNQVDVKRINKGFLFTYRNVKFRTV